MKNNSEKEACTKESNMNEYVDLRYDAWANEKVI